MSTIQGTWRYAAGTSGTVTLPKGATVKQIVAHASAGGASFTIFNGSSIPVPSGATITLRQIHDQAGAGQTPGGDLTIVFTGTDMYFVESIGPGYTAT